MWEQLARDPSDSSRSPASRVALRPSPDLDGELGGRKLASLQSIDVQRLVDAMLGEDLDPSTIRNTVNSLRAVFRRACRPGGDVSVNPTLGLELPSVDSRRDRIAEPDEAVRLLEALPAEDRALWAAACYAGIRLGELRALEYDPKEGLDLAGGVIHVRWGWDPAHGRIRPKSKAGIRDVPIAGVLRDYLIEHKALTGRTRELVFGRSETRPLNPSTVNARAAKAWSSCDPPLEPIGLHELRHTAVSTWIAAGIEAKQISAWAGHHSVSFTYDRYGHLFQRRGEFEMAKLDAFLELANTQARLAQVAEA
jgi:integrase